MIRYLKVIMKGKVGNGLYCTLTHIQVFGKSMHLSLKESFKFVNHNKNSTQPAVAQTRVTSGPHETSYPFTLEEFLN